MLAVQELCNGLPLLHRPKGQLRAQCGVGDVDVRFIFDAHQLAKIGEVDERQVPPPR